MFLAELIGLAQGLFTVLFLFTSLFDHKFFRPLHFLSVRSLGSFRSLLGKIFGSLVMAEYPYAGMNPGDMEIAGPNINQIARQAYETIQKGCSRC
jgi:hypothetical protein